MVDREKVVKGIDICLQRLRCGEDCSYYAMVESDELYQQAVKNPWVEKPLAWVLYQVWRDVDAQKEDKNERENYK